MSKLLLWLQLAAMAASQPPSITQPPIDQVADHHNIVVLTCIARRYSTTTITWTGPVFVADVAQTDTGMTTSSAATIYIVDTSYGGQYTCSASNQDGSTAASAILYVTPIPTPEVVLTRIGESVSVMCVAQSFPSGNFDWEAYTSAFARFITWAPGINRQTITFSPITVLHGTRYRCAVTTMEFGRVVSTREARVVGN